MKKTSFTILAGALVALANCSSTGHATPIVGSIGFTGAYVQNGGTSGNLTTATSMTITTPILGTTTGDFTGASFVSFASPIPVNPATGLTSLWSVLVGATTYSFIVSTETQDLTSPAALHIIGTGIIRDGNVADDTAGTFQLGFGVSGASFQWQSTAAAVGAPDGASTLLLLGAALSSLGFIRSKTGI